MNIPLKKKEGIFGLLLCRKEDPYHWSTNSPKPLHFQNAFTHPKGLTLHFFTPHSKDPKPLNP
jgi:hypothetical protein